MHAAYHRRGKVHRGSSHVEVNSPSKQVLLSHDRYRAQVRIEDEFTINYAAS